MGDPVVVPFQVLKAATGEGVSSKKDSLDEMACYTACAAFIDGLDDIKCVRLKNDLGKLHFLSQKNSLLKGHHLHHLSRELSLKDFVECSDRMAFVIPDYDPNAGVLAIVGKGTINIDFKISIGWFQPSTRERSSRKGGLMWLPL